MKGEIIKILPKAYSRNGNEYIRVMIRLENMNIAFTDLCEDFRNFKNWKHFLKVGNRIAGLELIRKDKINADSLIYVPAQKLAGHWEQKPNGNMAWVVDGYKEEKSLPKISLKQTKLI